MRSWPGTKAGQTRHISKREGKGGGGFRDHNVPFSPPFPPLRPRTESLRTVAQDGHFLSVGAIVALAQQASCCRCQAQHVEGLGLEIRELESSRRLL